MRAEEVIRKVLSNLLENDRSKAFIFYQSFSFSLLMLSVIFGIYDELKGFHWELHPYISALEFIVSLIIAFEYLGRLYLAENKGEYLVNPLSIIDLIALIPYLQPFRLLRFIVIGARFMRVAYRYRYFVKGITYVFRQITFEFYFLLSFFILFFTTSVVIMYSLEKGAGNPNVKSLSDAIYLVVITMTTVGYGDITPVTKEGRVLSMILGAGGLFIFSTSIATISAGFFNYVQMLKMGMISFKDMKDHIVLCGWNETAQVILENLKGIGRDVVVITEQEIQLPEWVRYKKGDFGREDILLDAGVEKAHMVIVLAEKNPGFSEDSIDAKTILTGMQVRDLNKDAVLILEILLRENAKLIKRRRIANYLIIGGELLGFVITKFIEEKSYGDFFNHIIEKVSFGTLRWNKESTVLEAEKELESEGLRIVGVVRDHRTTFFPKTSHLLKPGDKLIVVKERRQ